MMISRLYTYYYHCRLHADLVFYLSHEVRTYDDSLQLSQQHVLVAWGTNMRRFVAVITAVWHVSLFYVLFLCCFPPEAFAWGNVSTPEWRSLTCDRGLHACKWWGDELMCAQQQVLKQRHYTVHTSRTIGGCFCVRCLTAAFRHQCSIIRINSRLSCCSSTPFFTDGWYTRTWYMIPGISYL